MKNTFFNDIFFSQLKFEIQSTFFPIINYKRELINRPEQKELIDTMVEISNKIFGLIKIFNQIEHLAELESGRMIVNEEEVIINQLVSEIIKEAEHEARKKNIYTRISIAGTLKLKTDRKILYIILKNIIDNAIHFTDKGGVTVECSTAMFDRKVKYIIQIIDTGPGITDLNHKKIYDDRIDDTIAQNQFLMKEGMRLMLTKKFVELLNGNLSITGRLGKGIVYRVELDLS